MVSQLSARLLQGYASSSGGSTAGKDKKEKHYAGAASAAAMKVSPSTTHCSGYAADMDQQSLSSSAQSSGQSKLSGSKQSKPPVYIDFLAPHRKKKHQRSSTATNASQESSKKARKVLEELNYQAATAVETLKQGNLPVPVLRTNRPRSWAAQQKGVDMTAVSHAYAKTVQESPFLFPATDKKISKQYDIVTANLISSIVQNCSTFYKIPPPPASAATAPKRESRSKCQQNEQRDQQEQMSDDDASSTGSTSSVTDDQDDGTYDSPGQQQSSKSKEKKQQGPRSILISEALSLCNQPRLVTLSTPPFTIVHVNAAYTRLTGATSCSVLGQPLKTLVNDNNKSFMMENQQQQGVQCEDEPSLTSLHNDILSFKTNSKHDGESQRCKVTVACVGSQQEVQKQHLLSSRRKATMKSTHFVLDLEKSRDANETQALLISG